MKRYLFIVLAALGLVSTMATPGFAETVIGAAKDWQLGMVEGASPVKHEMHDFHNILMWVISAIVALVMLLLIIVVVRFNEKSNPVPSKTSHNTLLEVFWTGVPILILLAIGIPSMRLLYFTDKVEDAEMTIIATGYQWYWGYEYPDHDGINFLSYMVPEEDLKEGQLRLLETDNRVVVPVDTNIRIQIKAADVLHSFAVPSLGLKTDAVPGHLNETWTRIENEGVYYGQCSELCGKDHGFMPITIEAVSKEDFKVWVEKAKQEFSDASPALYPTKTEIAYLGE